MLKKKSISLVIFSLSVPDKELAAAIRSITPGDAPVYCMSPHVPFDVEKIRIQELADREVIFISLYEFISQAEMEYCDRHADELMLEEYGTREGNLERYYNKIKQLKNDVILKNILLKFELEDKLILADDLGLTDDVWIKRGFKQRYSTQEKVKVKRKNLPARIYGSIKRFLTTKWIDTIIVSTGDENYYFFGQFDRVRQYLDATKYSSRELPVWEMSCLNILFKLAGMSRSSPLKYFYFIFLSVFRWLKRKNVPIFLTTIHEYNDVVGYVGSKLKTKLVCMQDGLLPGYYPSAYLKYYVWVDRFFIWDHLSGEIFRRHGLNCDVWNGYKTMRLPFISGNSTHVRRVVFLTSGSGDWTALKNRSDEDLAFLAYVDAAKANPEIVFIYRPHPLWVHSEHQGVMSIQRLFDYKDELGLSNLSISTGALIEGNKFRIDGNVSKKFDSINDEINSSDIVFGDHSQALLEASKSRKYIASISLARRTEFFSNFVQLGFPILRTSGDISTFIKGVQGGGDFISKYNAAIERYNVLEAGRRLESSFLGKTIPCDSNS